MATKLTKKERGFIKDFIKTGNGTVSIKENYDVSNDNVAGVMAHTKLRKDKIKKVLNPIIDRYRNELDAILRAMELKDKNSEQYRTLVEATDKLQKQIQLLTGGSTENIAIKPLATLQELKDDNNSITRE